MEGKEGKKIIHPVLIYTDSISPRLRYITEFSAREIFVDPITLTMDREEFINSTRPKINYSQQRFSKEEYWIRPYGLLFQDKIINQEISVSEMHGRPAFFQVEGDHGFDIFSAAFYLLTRYEEYLPHSKDMYGRYAHENSLAFKHGFLQTPLVNHWLFTLAQRLTEKFPTLQIKTGQFNFIPTYDIDIAWSFRHKGFLRNTGGLFRSLFSRDWQSIVERIKVLRGKIADPYDAFEWMNQLHERYALKPVYFFLLAAQTGKYDKNISPRSRVMQRLISEHKQRYQLGIHPSWQSGDDIPLLESEIAALRFVTGEPVLNSRQHYIRMTIPQTYRLLIACGIRADYSMGYGSINGFRASVASPFHWYDLERELKSELVIYPFCYMEANSYYEQHFTAEQAMEEMRHYFKVIKSVGGTYVMIWHNSALGTDKNFVAWKNAYGEFIKEVNS